MCFMPYRPVRAAVAAVSLAFAFPAAAAELPATLSSPLVNLAGDTLTSGSPDGSARTLLHSGASITNDGQWNAAAGIITVADSAGPVPAISNTGTLTVNAPGNILHITEYPAAPHTLPLAFTNTGTVNVDAGALYLAASDTGSTTGAFHVASGATLGINGRFTFDENSAITGEGNLLISRAVREYPNFTTAPYDSDLPFQLAFNGVLALTGTATITGVPVVFNHDTPFANLQLNADLSGSGALTVAGHGIRGGGTSLINAPTWAGGTISNPALTVTGDLAINLAYGSGNTLDGTALTIDKNGFLYLSGSTTSALYFANHASLTNNGIFTLGSDSLILRDFVPSDPRPGVITNNGTMNFRSSVGFSTRFLFDNNGTINIYGGNVRLPQLGADAPTAVVNIHPSGTLLLSARAFHGTINNSGYLGVYPNTAATLDASVRLINTGYLHVSGATLTLAAAQDPLTTGHFSVDSDGALTFAADYDFSAPAGPTLDGTGLVIIAPGTTLTLPMDTAFAGTLQVDGTLLLAAPLDPANAGITPRFMLLPTPEPASLALFTFALPALRRRRRR
jgi:hypothetical protein